MSQTAVEEPKHVSKGEWVEFDPSMLLLPLRAIETCRYIESPPLTCLDVGVKKRYPVIFESPKPRPASKLARALIDRLS